LLIDKEYQKPKNLKEIKSANKRKKTFSGNFENKSGKKTLLSGKFVQTRQQNFSQVFGVRFLKERFWSDFLSDFAEL
jgi:hypothetical protein